MPSVWLVPCANFPDGLFGMTEAALHHPPADLLDVAFGPTISAADYYFVDCCVPRELLGKGVQEMRWKVVGRSPAPGGALPAAGGAPAAPGGALPAAGGAPPAESAAGPRVDGLEAWQNEEAMRISAAEGSEASFMMTHSSDAVPPVLAIGGADSPSAASSADLPATGGAEPAMSGARASHKRLGPWHAALWGWSGPVRRRKADDDFGDAFT